MALTARRSGNDWQKQPRDPDTGRFLSKHPYAPRWTRLMLRISDVERLMIETASAREGKSMTAWIMDACRAAAERRR